MKPFKYLPIVIAITVIAALITYWVIANNEENYNNHKNEVLNRFKSNYETVLAGYEKSARLFYSQVIESENIMSILRKIPSSYGDDKDLLRRELYNELKDNYKNLQQLNFRQLHFHLPTGESFIRFHRPEKYGDNLFPVRYSVEKTNKTLSISKGFEEGRIFNGYRFVFPILENERHYGSVEVSVSFLAISKALKEIEPVHTSILFKKEVIDRKVFESEKNNYEICKPLPDYVFDKTIMNDSSELKSYKLIKNLFTDQTAKINEQLKYKYASLKDLTFNDKNYILITIPIPNVKGKQIGNAFIVVENNELQDIRNKLYFRLSILILLYLIIIVAVIAIIKRDKKLIFSREQVKKSEINLAESGEIKNKLFEIITHDLRNHFNAVNGFIDLLDKRIEIKEEKVLKLYNGLNDAIELTNHLMDNLFVWSRIQIDKINLQINRFEASSWLEGELKRFANIIARKDITLFNKTKKSVYFNADVDMMRYIHQNILLNAIRYSDKHGKITIEIIDKGKETVLSIKDEGKGMTSNEVAKILNQESWTGSKLKNENGLGLLIARKLVAYQNGRIQIESAKGIGTTVTIEIPK